MANTAPEHGLAFPGPDKIHQDIYPAISAAQTPSLRQPGKVVLITGAGRGCGRAMALQYAHAGVACLILVARTTKQLDEVEKEIKKIDDKIRVHKFSVEVSREDAVAACADAVKKEEGRLDILINNAGVLEPHLKLGDSDPSTWWKTYEVNVRGPYLFLHAFLPLLVGTAEKNKTIVDVVNLTSIGALMAMPGFSSYQTTKLAICRLTEFVATEYGDKGVNAIAMHPGGVMTDMGEGSEVLRPCEFR